jgi:S1-C subfamily serine protease
MQEAIRKAEPSIACILITRSDEPSQIDLSNPNLIPESYGSGVVIDEKGLILTNRHVINGATAIYVRLPGNKAGYAEIHADDPRSDLAVLRLADPRILPLLALTLGDGGNTRKGQFVVTLANPFAAGFRDGSPSASWGIISNVRRRAPGSNKQGDQDRILHHYGTLLQTDARLNLGCSGGALIDLKGELIGLTTSQAAIAGGETPGGFAVPMDAGMKRIIEVLARGEEVEYGFLGVEFAPSGTDGRRAGILIKRVILGSPAYQAGLRDNDLLLKVNGIEVNDSDELFLTIGTHLAGSTIRVDVRTPDNRVKTGIPVTLAKFYVPERLGKPVVTNRPRAPGGLRVDYASILAQRLGTGMFGGAIPSGVVIREVLTNSAADRVRLQADKIITQVNGREVRTPVDFYREMDRAASSVEITLFTSDGRQDRVKLDMR